MDRNTVSHYGWIVVSAMVISILIVLATPFGKYMIDGATSIAKGFMDTSDEVVNEEALKEMEDQWADKLLTETKDGKIPAGGTYIVAETGEELTEGSKLPESKVGDIYRYGDYEYCYGYGYDAEDIEWNKPTMGWGVRVIDRNKTEYGKILQTINNIPITSATFAFRMCENLVVTPYLPDTVLDLEETFSLCYNLEKITNIPKNAVQFNYFAYECNKLQSISRIPQTAESVNNAFGECSALTGKIELPCKFNDDNISYTGCNATIEFYHYDGCRCEGTLVPENGTYIDRDGTTYTSNDKMPANPKTGDTYIYGDYTYVYNAAYNPEIGKWVEDKNIMGWGVRVNDTGKVMYKSMLSEIGNGKVRSVENAYNGCTKIQEAPIIPNTVIYVDNAFDNCTTMEDNITLPCRFDGIVNSFSRCYATVEYQCPERCRHNSPGEIIGENAFYATNYKYDRQIDAWRCDDIYVRNDLMPSTANISDYYTDGIYEYCYGYTWCEDYCLSTRDGCDYTTTEWSAHFIANTQAPPAPRSKIANSNLTSLRYAYTNTSLVTPPAIPATVNDMVGIYSESQIVNAQNIVIPFGVKSLEFAFGYCEKLQYGPKEISSQITNLDYAFSQCVSLKTVPSLTKATSLRTMVRTFENCKTITTLPTIPNNVSDMSYAFSNCESLLALPSNFIGTNVTNITGMFYGCKRLTNDPMNALMIPASVTSADNCFKNIPNDIYITNNNDYSIGVLSKLITESNNINLVAKKDDIRAKTNKMQSDYAAPYDDFTPEEIANSGWSVYKFTPKKSGYYAFTSTFGSFSGEFYTCCYGEKEGLDMIFKDCPETKTLLEENGVYDSYGFILTKEGGQWSTMLHDDDEGGSSSYINPAGSVYISKECEHCGSEIYFQSYMDYYSFYLYDYLEANQGYYIYIMPFSTDYPLTYTDYLCVTYYGED